MGSDDADEDRDRVLAPDDLDITKRPEVEEIDDGRYVVSPNGPAKKPNRELLDNPDWLSEEADEDAETAPERSRGRSPEDTPPQDTTQSTTPQSPSDTHPSSGPRYQEPRQTDHPTQNDPTRQSTPTEPTQSTDSQPPAGGSGQPTPTGQSTPPSQPSNQPQQSPPNQSQEAPSNQPNQSPSNQPTQSQPNQSTARSQSSEQPRAQNQSQGGSRPDKPDNAELAAHNQPPAEPPAAEITNENVSKFLAQSLAQTSGDYGFDATVNIEGSVNRGRMTSDDIGETLETLLRWYARQTTDEVDPEHVLGIILAGSDLAVEYPVQSAYSVVKKHGLGPDDTISDLLAAVREEGSFTVPPSKE